MCHARALEFLPWPLEMQDSGGGGQEVDQEAVEQEQLPLRAPGERRATGGKLGDDTCCCCRSTRVVTSLSGKTECGHKDCPNGLDLHTVHYCTKNKCTEFACGKYQRKSKRPRSEQQRQQQPTQWGGAMQLMQLLDLLTSGIDNLAEAFEGRAAAAGITNFEFVIAATEIAKQRAIARAACRVAVVPSVGVLPTVCAAPMDAAAAASVAHLPTAAATPAATSAVAAQTAQTAAAAPPTAAARSAAPVAAAEMMVVVAAPEATAPAAAPTEWTVPATTALLAAVVPRVGRVVPRGGRVRGGGRNDGPSNEQFAMQLAMQDMSNLRAAAAVLEGGPAHGFTETPGSY